MKALQIRRNIARFGAARVVGAVSPSGATKVGPLEYRTIEDPERPGDGWHRVRTRLAGICGSDLSLIGGRASTYFESWVSFPFVPGHEVVGELVDGDEAGTRVVLEPVLGHAARDFPLPFDGARPADGDDYAHLAVTSQDGVEPAIQTGFCCSTGGGWAPWFWAHESQLHRLNLPITTFPTNEPCSSSHSLVESTPHCSPHQSWRVAPIQWLLCSVREQWVSLQSPVCAVTSPTFASWSERVTPTNVSSPWLSAPMSSSPPTELDRAVRREVGCHMLGGGESGALSSGADVTIDAVGSSRSIADSLRITRPRGRVVLLGMPAHVELDLTGLWHREIDLKGAYTYGTETLSDGTVTDTFHLAIDTVTAVEAERLLSATYSLDEHLDAIDHAATAGRRGAIKIAFDLRESN